MKPFLDLSFAASSLAAPGTVISNPIEGGYDAAQTITIIASLLGLTGGTLDITIQDSPDGVTWYDYARFPQLAAAAPAISYSFVPALSNAIVTIGRSVDPATPVPVLTAGSVRGGRALQFLRAVAVAGAGASAGAIQTIKVFAR